MKNCVFDFVFLLENFLFTNLLSHVILLIVDGFPSINKQISTFKKKYFDDIIKKLDAKRHFWFYCLQENDISRGN